jgi:hypothetical protein
MAEELDVLKGAGNAQSGNVIRLQAVDGLVLESNCALIGLVNAVDAVEQGGLAGPVRADDGIYFSALDRKRDIFQGCKAPERYRYVFNFKKSHNKGHIKQFRR